MVHPTMLTPKDLKGVIPPFEAVTMLRATWSLAYQLTNIFDSDLTALTTRWIEREASKA